MKPSIRENSSFDRTASGISPVAAGLIVALDFPDAAAALTLVDQLDGATRWFKIGLELYIAEGNALVAEVLRLGYRVFLDLKLHDIPNTVASAVQAASRLGVDMLTIHAAGGGDMLAAAVEAAGKVERSPALLAVTVLTSMDNEQLAATGVTGSPGQQVERLARMALGCGVQGLVCSPNEVGSLRRVIGDKPLLVVPGIRPAGASIGDQRRVATPGSAVADGASYLVVGRPITQAVNPGAAARAILAEMDLGVERG